MTTPFHRAAVYLRHAESVVIGGHVKPDGDALGSILGLTLALRGAGIAAVPVLADENLPSTYSFLPGYALFASAIDVETPDVFVAVDTPSLSRLGAAEPLATGAETVISIDHHPDNALFGEVNLVDEHAAASGQLVWHLLERLEVRPTPEIALCLYVALLTDTGRFQYQNTNAAALRDAAAMLDAGVDPAETARLVYQSRSAAALALDSRVMSRITLANSGRVAYSHVSDEDFQQTGAQSQDSENLVDVVRTLGGVDVVLLFRFHDGETRVNLRSKTGFDVGSLAREFGGGGHAAAAGFTAEKSLEQVLAEMLPRLPGAGGS